MHYCGAGIERMTRNLLHIIVLIFSITIATECTAQGISVQASIDRNKILIGEPIQLTLEATLPTGIPPTWFPLDTLPHFEFIEHGKIDTVKSMEGKAYKQVLTITSFDSGRWAIPVLSLDLNGRSYLTDSLPVSVAFSNFDASQDYHDIKDILTVESASLSYINWLIAAITLLSLVALIYFLRKRQQKVAEPVIKTESSLSPLDEAIRALNELQSRQLPEKGQVKTYYTGLNDILRVFITRKLSLATMQKTSEELVLQVRNLGLPNDTFISMVQTLRMSDAVKFAKYVPGREDNEESLRNIKTSIELLNNLKT